MRDLKLSVIKIAIIIIIILVLALSLMFIFGTDSPPEEEPPDYEALAIFQTSDNQTLEIKCEVASTPEEKRVGLMGVEQLPADEGMVFTFEEPRTVTFWMRNVVIPLDMVFIDENMTIVKIAEADIEPEGTPDANMTQYYSEVPVKYVVELNQGICSSNGIMIGSQVNITFED